jgi:predicted transcriptional regulator
MARTVLMAIRPLFAQAIYENRKRFEYRRVRTSIESGDCILIYESSSRGLVTGEFTAGSIYRETPTCLSDYEMDCDIQAQVNSYLSNARTASAIEILNPIKWKMPRSIAELGLTVRPPQSYIFIS